jgi:uncharacterized protein with beta-barrel porin domain
VGILFFTVAFLAVAVLCGAVPVRATVLTVDNILGNSPYNVATTLTYDNESVGVSSQGGIMNQAGYTNAVSEALNVGAQSGATGTYNLSGTGSLTVTITSAPAAWEYVGVSGGAGTFNQSGGINNMPGAILFVGSDVLGAGKGGTGTYNLSGGLILSTRQGVGTNAGPGTGVEAIGDSGGNGTFNQTGGTNNCNNGVFVGSDTEWVYGGFKNAHTGGAGVYNLSGADSVLITSGAVKGDARGGEVVGDGGGIGTFNQTGGTNNATWSGLAVGSDIYGSGYGGVGVFNLSGGSLAASPLPEAITHSQAIGGEIIGTTRGIGTFNQSGGTNAVQAGLFVGSDINYALQNNVRAGGAGAYNLSGGSLTASGSGTPGASGYIPGEDIGDAGGTGTFTQTGGTNTVTQGLLVGTDIYGSGKAGRGTYNLSGTGVLSVQGINIGDASEYVGVSGGAGTFNQSGGTNNMPGATLYVGTGILGSGGATAGTYNLSGGTIYSSRVGEATGAEAIGDSGAHGTFNQTGGTNTCNNGVFVGSNVSWRYSLGKTSMPGAVGVYNLSGGILDTSGDAIAGGSGDGGEVVGDAGGTGTFNQSGGKNIATDGGLAVGSDIYGAGVGGVGTFNLGGGSLAASGLTGSVGGEVIGTCQGIGTFNQTGGTNTVLVGLFVGSQVTYPLAPTKNISPGTGTYNLSGGSLTASGSGAWGEAGFIPGEDIGDAGSTGTFTQTGGVNTVANGLVLGTDLFDSIGSGKGTGAYNLSGGVLQADFEWVGGAGAGTFTQTGGSNTVTGSGASYGIEMNGGTYALKAGTLTANSFDGNLENAGGTFVPSKGGATGSAFTGNYTQGKNGVLQINIASANNYSWLNMNGTGTAIFNGGSIQPMPQGGFVPNPGETFDVIRNAQSITGAPAVENFTATMAGVEGDLADPGTTITAVRDYTNSELSLTQNQRQVGNMLNKVSGATTGDLGTVLHSIDSIPASDANLVGKVYQQFSPDVAASLANLGFAASAFFQQDLSERITSLRYAGLAGAGPGAASQVNGWNFYADPQVFWGSQSSTAQETGYNFSIGGFTAGVDYRVNDDLLVGVASGYGHTDAKFYDNLGNVENDTVPVNLYAAYFPGSFYALGSAGYSVNLFTTNRQTVFGAIDREASGSTTGNTFNGYGEAGYDLKAGGVVVTPMASLAYSSLWIDGFGETGAGSLDLNVNSQHADSLQLGPGVRLATTLNCGAAVIAPQFYASYEHEVSNDSRGIDASLANVGVPFSFQSQRLGADFGLIGGSVTLFSGKNFSVQLDSNAEIGRANYNAYTVDVGLSFRL